MSDTEFGEVLQRHKQELEHRLTHIRQDMQRLLQEQEDVLHKISAADVLLADIHSGPKRDEPLLPIEQEAPRRTSELRRKTVAQAAAAVLAKEGRPLTVSEITAAILAGGARFDSKTPDKTVATTLYRNPQFVKVAPGTFALVTRSDAAAMSPKSRTGRLNEVGAVRLTETLLREEGKPMHVREILRQLQEQGFRTYAARPEAMLSGTLRRSKKFAPLGDDNWGLVEWQVA